MAVAVSNLHLRDVLVHQILACYLEGVREVVDLHLLNLVVPSGRAVADRRPQA